MRVKNFGNVGNTEMLKLIHIILNQDYKYFGLQNGDSCYCGNDDSQFVPVPPEECDHPCSGNANEKCGSSWRLSVYGPNKIIDVSPRTTTMSTSSASSTRTATELTSTTTTESPTTQSSVTELPAITTNRSASGFYFLILIINNKKLIKNL